MVWDRIMNIVYHCSDKFVSVLGTSIASLLENNQDAESIDIFVIEHEILPENKAKLKKIVKDYNRTLHYIPMPDINQKEKLGLKLIKKTWLFDSYCRLFLNHILPENIKRVIYLDSDVLVVGNLDELWNFDLQGKCVGAAKDSLGANYFSLFGLDDQSVYCNSGVLLIDLNIWREKKCDKRIQQYVQEQNGYVFFMEQSALNIALQDEIEILPARFNVKTEMMALSYHDVLVLRKPVNWYLENEVIAAVKCPVIIHMTSIFLIHSRAWVEGTNHPAKPIYDKYKMLTPWKDNDDFLDRRGKVIKLKNRIIDALPNVVLLPIVSFIYNNIRIMHIRRNMKKYSRK